MSIKEDSEINFKSKIESEIKSLNALSIAPLIHLYFNANEITEKFHPHEIDIDLLSSKIASSYSLKINHHDDFEKCIEDFKDVLMEIREKALTADDIKWITSSERASLWLFLTLTMDEKNNKKQNVMNNSILEHSMRIVYIVRYFQLKRSQRELQIKLIDRYSSQWREIIQSSSLLWINKLSPEMILHVWNYMAGGIFLSSDIIRDYYKGHVQFMSRFKAPYKEELPLLITGYFDVILHSNSEKNSLEKRIKAIISQKKHRDKKGRQHIDKHFFLKKENQGKLLQVLESRGCTIEDYFNDMIEKDYNEIQSI